jgi:sec-independent protein translocase protein TatC
MIQMAENDSQQMGFLDHLQELRVTIFWVGGIVAVATVGSWFFSDQIVDFLLRPAREAGQETLYFSAPMEAFLLKLKASVVVGILVGFPLILQRIYMFVLPGLLPREKRVVTPLLFASTALFYVGVLFCFLILLPLVIRFAVGFATEYMQPWLTVGSYFSMAARLCLAFGLLFELPMVVFALSWARIVHPRTLLRGWRWALLSILIVSAVLTPPDVISQVLLAGPVMLLYVVSVLISMIVRRKEDAPSGDENDDDDDPDPGSGGGGGHHAAPPPPPPDPRPAPGTRARGEPASGEGTESGD